MSGYQILLASHGTVVEVSYDVQKISDDDAQSGGPCGVSANRNRVGFLFLALHCFNTMRMRSR